MPVLTTGSRERAEAFLLRAARPLEQARLRYDLGLADADDVLRELAAFGNPDGGYGHGLEPDLRLADSSAICTSVALQVMAEITPPADHPLVLAAMAYLVRTHDAAAGVWQQVPPNVGDAPHAPWWEHNPDPGRQMANPQAELVGAAYRFVYVPAPWRDALAEAVTVHAEEQHASLSVPDLVCYRRLLEAPGLPAALGSRLLPPLRMAIRRLFLEHPEPGHWVATGMGPLELAPEPGGPFAEDLASLVQEELDGLVQSQCADGSWAPTWTWGGRHPDAWAVAEREWRGVLTLQALRHLAAYGRVQLRRGDFPLDIRPVV
jgi:hypothetical protein